MKEARSLTKPNDGFITQLKDLDDQLFGQKKKDTIEDPFTLKKRQEIEAEKAALKSAVKLKDRVKLFAEPTEPDSRSSSPQITANKLKWDPDVNRPQDDDKITYKQEVITY